MPSLSLRSALAEAPYAAPLTQIEPDRSAKTAPGALAFAVVTDRAGFDALAPDWTALMARAPRATQVFQTFNWAWHWCNAYLPANGGSPALAIVTVRRGGQLIALWPLVRERILGITRLSWLGDPVGQYGDVIVDDVADRAEVLAQSWRFIRQSIRADVIVLRKVRGDSDAAACCLGAGLAPRCVEDALYTNLAAAGDFETYELRWPAKLRKNRRRHMRRLQDRGPVAIDHHLTGERAIDAITRGIDLKRIWIEKKGLISRAFSDQRFDRFMLAAATSTTHPTGAFVSLLTSDGTTGNVVIAFDHLQCRTMHMIAYNLDFETLSAGTLHIEDCVRQAFADGIETMDFLGPKVRYKMDWCEKTVPMLEFQQPITLRGRLYSRACQTLGCTPTATMAAVLPQPVRRALAWGLKRVKAVRKD
jgi:CelD/BcsL family acetyltransferase involved in cellulose biosynthesis